VEIALRFTQRKKIPIGVTQHESHANANTDASLSPIPLFFVPENICSHQQLGWSRLQAATEGHPMLGRAIDASSIGALCTQRRLRCSSHVFATRAGISRLSLANIQNPKNRKGFSMTVATSGFTIPLQ
jgi:hypothetical protein